MKYIQTRGASWGKGEMNMEKKNQATRYTKCIPDTLAKMGQRQVPGFLAANSKPENPRFKNQPA